MYKILKSVTFIFLISSLGCQTIENSCVYGSKHRIDNYLLKSLTSHRKNRTPFHKKGVFFNALFYLQNRSDISHT
jgi:hypothetical protein